MLITDYLKDPGCNPPPEIEKYLNGDCDIFAIAASRIFKYEIVAITEERLLNGLIKGTGLVHAYVKPKRKGSEYIFDAKGLRHANLLANEYSLNNEMVFHFMDEKELIDLVHKPGDPLYKTHTFDELEVFILEAQNFINKYYLHR